jgi:hypothetical protein
VREPAWVLDSRRLSELSGTSYFVLRARAEPDAPAWWLAVRRRPDVPEAISVLLAGRARVEVSREEAEDALAWAARIEGWASAEAKPLFVYQRG